MEKIKNSLNIQFLSLSIIFLLPILIVLGTAVAEVFLFFLTFYGVYKIFTEKNFP